MELAEVFHRLVDAVHVDEDVRAAMHAVIAKLDEPAPEAAK